MPASIAYGFWSRINAQICCLCSEQPSGIVKNSYVQYIMMYQDISYTWTASHSYF